MEKSVKITMEMKGHKIVVTEDGWETDEDFILQSLQNMEMILSRTEYMPTIADWHAYVAKQLGFNEISREGPVWNPKTVY